MMATIGFTLRRHRLEMIVFGLVLLGLVAVASWVAIGLANLRLDQCASASGSLTADCQARVEASIVLQNLIPIIQATAVFGPPLAGLFLGATVVSREIEARTAMFAWSFAGSRARWLLERSLVLIVPLGLLSLLAGMAVDAIYAVSLPGVPLARNLVDYQIRGPLLAAHGLLAFGGALLVGALTGRLLPALLLSAVCCTALVGGGMYLADQLNRADPIRNPGPASIMTASLYRTADGRILTAAQAVDELPTPDTDFGSFYTPIDVGVPGERAPLLVGRTMLANLLATTLLLLATAAVVERRRPY